MPALVSSRLCSTELIERAVAALDLLESEPFDAVSHASRFQQAMTLAVAFATWLLPRLSTLRAN